MSVTKISLVQWLITNLNVILYFSTCHTLYISVLILFMIMTQLVINTYVSLMYELKKLERYLRVNLFGPGPRLIKKEFTRPRSHKVWETMGKTTGESDMIPGSGRDFRSHSLIVTPSWGPAPVGVQRLLGWGLSCGPAPLWAHTQMKTACLLLVWSPSLTRRWGGAMLF